MSEGPGRSADGRSSTLPFLALVAAAAVGFGVAVRATNLDRKLFWVDEAYGALRISGHTERELYAAFDGRTVPARDLAALQRLAPGHGPVATVASLASEEPQRGPLFYVAARLWAGAFGDGVGALRAFSALLGVAGIVFAFLAGSALGGRTCGLVAAALFSASPVEVRFAQQAREYVLFVDATLVGVWLVARGAASRGVPSWRTVAAWVLAAAAGLYAFSGYALVLVAEAAALAVARPRALGRFVLAGAVAAAAYVPWLAVQVRGAGQASRATAWLLGAYPPKGLALKWAFNLAVPFFDAEFASVRLAAVAVVALSLAAVASAAALRRFARGDLGAALTTALALSAALPLVVLDGVRHAHYEVVTRYLLSSLAGLTLLVALGIGRALASRSPAERRAAAATFVALAGVGVWSCALGARPEIWWDDNEFFDERAVARAVDAPLPVAIFGEPPSALVLARYLPPATPLVLPARAPWVPPHGVNALFAYRPPALERDALVRAGFDLRDVSPPLAFAVPSLHGAAEADDAATNALWRATRRSPSKRLPSAAAPATGAERTTSVP